ncbi:hypothetical protein N9Z41_02760 [bacterium]|nr:hypothetical protein [bacterium]
MKLAWICYQDWDDDDDIEYVIVFKEPEKYMYSKIIPIVYAELKGESDE